MTTPVVTLARPKPELQAQLRDTWRKSAEHKAAQVKRFISALVGVVTLNVVSDIVAHKDPLSHFADGRTAWYYLLPLAYVAWRQLHPAMTASQVDSAPGATIVPEQVGATSDVPVPDPTAADVPPVDAGSDANTPEGDGPLVNYASAGINATSGVSSSTYTLTYPQSVATPTQPKKKATPAKKVVAKKTVAKKATPAKKTAAKKTLPPKA